MQETNENRANPFLVLREEIIRSNTRRVQQRIEGNPQKSQEEQVLGCYVEELEDQVREAVLELNRKGYKTFWSGFFLEEGTGAGQVIRGMFNLQPVVIERLKQIDVNVTQDPDSQLCEIWFIAQEPDVEKIKERWNSVAEILPTLN